MSHLSEQTLAKLLNRNLSSLDRSRIRRHVERCRACARQLEEWRDYYTEVEEELPEVPRLDVGVTASAPGGSLILPGDRPGRRLHLDLATVLWVIALLLAVVVGYAAFRLREQPEPRVAYLPPPAYSPPVVDSPGALGDTAVPGAAVPAAAAARPLETTRPPRPRESAPPRPEPAPRVVPDPAPSQAPPTGAVPTTPGFRQIGFAEAMARLGGSLRFIAGLDPDHLEVGSGTAVPGALKQVPIVRVVYRAADGSRILLDQQRIPADSSGFRPMDDPTLETGQIAIGTSPSGVSVATWVDDDGYRLSLAVRASQDSLQNLIRRVQ
jgi:hypothetical protein